MYEPLIDSRIFNYHFLLKSHFCLLKSKYEGNIRRQSYYSGQ